MNATPGDFRVTNEWHEASVPPPYHYEYTITLESSGNAEITLIPDYPAPEIPVWKEAFQASQANVERLYQTLITLGAFDITWQPASRPSVGGNSGALTVTAGGRHVEIPADVIPQQAPVAKEMAEAVVRMVPEPIWNTLNARRHRYLEATLADRRK